MIGIDEVGRGCWAGPMLVVAARATNKLPAGLKDSKKLTRIRREKLCQGIRTSCDLGMGWVGAAEIDEFGLTVATRTGVERALLAIDANNDEEIIMDGTVNYLPKRYSNVLCVAKADNLYPVVSAASIYAKVARDAFMCGQVHQQFPEYGFNLHVGYGTAVHLAALKLHGVCEMHRISYRPVKLAPEMAG